MQGLGCAGWQCKADCGWGWLVVQDCDCGWGWVVVQDCDCGWGWVVVQESSMR